MRVFVYEYTSARNPEETGSLHAEGWAMLQAVVEDFGKIPGIETATLIHKSIRQQLGCFCHYIQHGKEEEAFRRLVTESDFTLVIAPEFDDILASRCRWVLEAGGRLLGSSPEVINTAADKYSLSGKLTPPAILLPKFERAAGLIPVARNPNGGDIPRCSLQDFFPCVLKPRFGAGSQATFLVRSASELDESMRQASEEMPDADFILQRFVPGIHASVAFLVGRTEAFPLLPAAQHLSANDRFHYKGGQIPLPADLAQRAVNLARRAIAATPGLQGYVGIDLVLGEAKDGSQDCVIEINPRLTTSYVGLRQLAKVNLARAWLDIVTGKRIPKLEWHSGNVRFLADGSLMPEPGLSFRARSGKSDAKP
jgi:tyramine---L-glutamate ligase